MFLFSLHSWGMFSVSIRFWIDIIIFLEHFKDAIPLSSGLCSFWWEFCNLWTFELWFSVCGVLLIPSWLKSTLFILNFQQWDYGKSKHGFFEVILFVIFWDSWIYKFISFNKFGNFICSSNMFSALISFSTPSGS